MLKSDICSFISTTIKKRPVMRNDLEDIFYTSRVIAAFVSPWPWQPGAVVVEFERHNPIARPRNP